jgi:hypothetical protein
LLFEVKELAEDENFKTVPRQVSSRTVGNHIRRRIDRASRQVQFGADQGIPSILLIYNNLDPMHLFGTEDTDFDAAMRGEHTVLIDTSTGKIKDSFHGLNRSLTADKNTSFSALGHLHPWSGKLTVTLFENVHAKVPVPYELLPPCFEAKRVQVVD